MRNLMGRLAARNAAFLLITSYVLAGFEFLMCIIVSTMNVSGALQELLKNLPPFVQTIVEEQFLGGLSSRSILAFGWNHPISLALGTAVAIVLASRAVAGEIEEGMMEMVLSQPISRRRYIGAHILFALAALGMVSLSGALGTLIGATIHGLNLFSLPQLAMLALNYFLMQVVWYGITLLFSVYARESGRVASAGFMLALISYLVSVISKLWKDAEFLTPYSLNTYFSPQAILVDDRLEVQHVLVLGVLFLITATLAFRRFLARDIP